MLPRLLLFSLMLLLTPVTYAQPVQDTLITWRGYSTQGLADVELYTAPPNEEDRPQTVLIRELAESEGPATVHDARHLAEIISRAFGFDPSEAYWIFHWGSFSYQHAEPAPMKELFLRATFSRTSTGNLSTPRWRLIRRDAVMELTDRTFEY